MAGPGPTLRLIAAGVWLLSVLPVCLALFPPPAAAHDPQDLVLQQVGVDERLGAAIPGELSFRDQYGKNVRLSDYFSGGPVILTLNYYACPTLCPLVFRNLAGAVNRLGGLALGRDFRIVTVSINPQESPALAREKAAATYAMLGGTAGTENSWPFLLGSAAAIERLARAVGVRYTRLEGNNFAHPSVLVVVTPKGRVSRYLYGLEQRPQDLRLALLEAAGGRIGGANLVNQALLYCFHYDPVGRKYVLFASRLMTIVMLGVLALTAGMLVVLWAGERRKQPPTNAPSPPGTSP
jgi:protein SCO1